MKTLTGKVAAAVFVFVAPPVIIGAFIGLYRMYSFIGSDWVGLSTDGVAGNDVAAFAAFSCLLCVVGICLWLMSITPDRE